MQYTVSPAFNCIKMTWVAGLGEALLLRGLLRHRGPCSGSRRADSGSGGVHRSTVETLLPRIPAGILRVAESGLHGVEDLKRVRAAGADAALVGTALMRAVDPARTLREWGEALR